MADTLTQEERSLRMSLVRARDTKPEQHIRSLLHRSGYRYRLYVRELPGTPDLVFPSRRKVIFVHGCFWHRHKCKLGDRLPKSHVMFWQTKLEANRRRDARNRRRLKKEGWGLIVVWECQIQGWSDDRILKKLISFIDK
jgi:DNA mismatch endonuclease (patch repair protein)